MVGTLGKGSRLERSGNGVLHILASVLAAAAAGYLLAAIGGLLPESLGMGLAAAVCLLYATVELGWTTLPLPETGRQVPAAWRYRFPSPITATLFGALLGPGLGTRVASSSYVALLAVTVLVPRPQIGAILLGLFGLTRATSAVIAAQSARHDPARALSWGYQTAGRWRLAGISLTFLITGALAAQAIAVHLGT
jgi:hypothetical protein